MKVEANGIQINYELSGQEGAPAVVLSHSLGTSLEMWNPQIAALEPHYRVLRYDTRGHGGSEAPAQHYTLNQLAEDAVRLLDVLGIDGVNFVGLSMGGMIGQCLALNYGNRLRSLVLCDTAALIPPEAQPVWQERIDTARENGLQALVESTLQRWFTPPGKRSKEIRRSVRVSDCEGGSCFPGFPLSLSYPFRNINEYFPFTCVY